MALVHHQEVPYSFFYEALERLSPDALVIDHDHSHTRTLCMCAKKRLRLLRSARDRAGPQQHHPDVADSMLLLLVGPGLDYRLRTCDQNRPQVRVVVDQVVYNFRLPGPHVQAQQHPTPNWSSIQVEQVPREVV